MQEQSIYEKLEAYAKSDAYPFHMPGHKRRMDWMANVYDIDITEIDGFDDLHHAEGMIKEGMERMAHAVGAKQSYYIVNGSTCGILAAIYGSCPQGATVAVARNTHKSVAHAILLRGLKPIYIYPRNVDNLCISGQVIHKDVEKAYEQSPDIAAVILTSPTYEGIASDIRAIADVVHAHNGILIVDEAHGAHLPYAQNIQIANEPQRQNPLTAKESRVRIADAAMETRLPYSAIHEGADIVIQSLHKTLPCLTQSAALHICSDRVDVKKIERALHIFETSSPSYVLMAGMDLCVRYMQKEGAQKLRELTNRLQLFYERSKNWKQLWFLYPEMEAKRIQAQQIEEQQLRVNQNKPCQVDKNLPIVDYTKIVFGARGYVNSGRHLHEILHDRYHLQPEMSAPDYVILMTMLTDTEEGFSRLEAALSEINDELEKGVLSWEKKDCVTPSPVFVPLRQAMFPIEAAEAETIPMLLEEAEGKISAETIYVYPPGCPFLMPGEEISAELLELVRYYKESGMELYGMEDETGERIRIVLNSTSTNS
jgi:arginine decarboxylase